MSKSNFQDMKVWQRARVLAREVYLETQRYPRFEMFGLSQQMRRAAVSVLCNIAEGQGRWSRPDARNFAVIARGSVLEIEAQLIVSSDLQYIGAERTEELINVATEVARMLNGLIKHYE
jgi:four helix bundle protein